ncbi:hypothetical protein GA0115246_100706 [Streptomyces sp. SolWspMP-sol7th]|nr:hypothetical protein GA0115246_100706 [Streptomyces sp. SolWspMP-sol7th]
MAVLKTVPSATVKSEDTAYGRSLTYCASEASGALPRPLRFPRRTSATGSISRSNATEHRSTPASG